MSVSTFRDCLGFRFIAGLKGLSRGMCRAS